VDVATGQQLFLQLVRIKNRAELIRAIKRLKSAPLFVIFMEEEEKEEEARVVRAGSEKFRSENRSCFRLMTVIVQHLFLPSLKFYF
jgi:hypothetical protein